MPKQSTGQEFALGRGWIRNYNNFWKDKFPSFGVITSVGEHADVKAEYWEPPRYHFYSAFYPLIYLKIMPFIITTLTFSGHVADSALGNVRDVGFEFLEPDLSTNLSSLTL